MKGVFIPIEILKDSQLSPLEKIILSEIYMLSNGRPCTASNAHFSENFAINKANCSRTIKRLENKKRIKIKLVREGKLVKSRQITPVKGYYQNDNTHTIKMITGYYQNDNGVLSKRQREITEEITTENVCNNEEKKEQQPANEYKGGGKINIAFRVKSILLKSGLTILDDDMEYCKKIAYKMRDIIKQKSQTGARPSDDQIIKGVEAVFKDLPKWIKEGNYFNAPFIARSLSRIVDEIRQNKRQISQKEAEEVQSRPVFAKRQNLPPKNEK